MTDLATIKNYMTRDVVKEKIEKILGENPERFITSAMSLVNSNTSLQKCDPSSIFSALITATTLNLPVNENLGFAYIVPYKDKASFQMGYKGYIQLAIRSGLFKRIKSITVYEGQLLEENPLEGNVYDWNNKQSEVPVGYLAYFKLTTGYTDELYMSKEDVEKHGKRYSQMYRRDSGLWKTDFDAMAEKTVLKLLLSKKGPLSIEPQIQKAVLADQSVIKDPETMEVEYIDNPPIAETTINTDEKLLQSRIDDLNECKSIEEVEKLRMENKPTNQDVLSLFEQRKNELS